MAIKAPMLRPGDTIGIVTLGSPLSSEIIDQRIETLRRMGFEVVIGRSVYGEKGIVAANAQARAADLMEMFINPDVRLILPTRGGTGVKDILPYLDYQQIKSHPKIITGYSDITVLLNVLFQFSNLITFQSLLLIDFSIETPHYNFDQFYAAVSELRNSRRMENPPGIPTKSLVPGDVTAPIVGGNLTNLVDTLGTPYEIDTNGKIFLIEETHEPTNKVYRYLTHLKMAGKFQDCLGIVMGECTNCPTAYNTTYEEVIEELLVPLGKPLLTGLCTAHGIYKVAVPIGAVVNLNTFTSTLRVNETTVSP